VATKKLVVSTYLQYILIALGALLLLTFVRQMGGVLLTFLLATILAYALNPLVRRLETWRVPRVVAVLGVFVALIVAVLAALLVLIIPGVSQIQALVQNPTVLTDGATRLLSWAQEELPYIGDQVATIDQATIIIKFAQSNAPSAMFVQPILAAALFLVAQQLEGNVLQPRIMGGSIYGHPLWVLFATLVGTALYGVVGALLAAPLVPIIAAVVRYLRETLHFERWRKAPVFIAIPLK
jgi:predicted PurR-regulated permease PerM